MKPPAVGVELAPPARRDVHTVEECDAVLARGPVGAALDGWLDERLSAMRALERDELQRAVVGWPPGR